MRFNKSPGPSLVVREGLWCRPRDIRVRPSEIFIKEEEVRRHSLYTTQHTDLNPTRFLKMLVS